MRRFLWSVPLLMALAVMAALGAGRALADRGAIVYGVEGELRLRDPSRALTMGIATRAEKPIAPAWSPDGTRVAYVSSRDGAYSLRVIDLRTRETNVYGGGMNTMLYPTWSPDGARLAFTSYNSQGGLQLFAITLADGIARPVSPAEWDVLIADWSPDGTQMAVSGANLREDRWPGIYLIEVSNGGITPLRQDIARLAYVPAWSPDGTHILYSVAGQTGSGLYLIEVATGEEETLMFPVVAYSPRWSPDGAEVVFSAELGEGVSLLVLDVESGTVRTLERDLNTPLQPDWSRLGW